MSDIVTDTHGLIWYLENDQRLSSSARAAFEACDRGELTIYVPTICLVEIVYLAEKGLIPANFKTRLDTVLEAGTSGLVPTDLTAQVADVLSSISRTDIPDMPDRIIAATATHLGLPVISKDSKIQASNIDTIW